MLSIANYLLLEKNNTWINNLYLNIVIYVYLEIFYFSLVFYIFVNIA